MASRKQFADGGKEGKEEQSLFKLLLISRVSVVVASEVGVEGRMRSVMSEVEGW